jgi:hypothetical protein
MTVRIDKLPNGTAIRISGVGTPSQKVQIVPGTIKEGTVKIGTSTVTGIEFTVRPA